MLGELVLFLLVMLAGTAGELAIARAMRTVGEVTDFSPWALVRVAVQVLRIPWTWIGLSLMTLGFFALLQVLSIENVSFVVPVTALGYAFGTLGGRIFLHERVSLARWTGVLLVCIGVALVVAGKP